MIPTRLKIREGGRNNNGYWFELERTEAKPGQDAGKDEENSVIVECKTEAKRDDLLKQIKAICQTSDAVGPFAFVKTQVSDYRGCSSIST